MYSFEGRGMLYMESEIIDFIICIVFCCVFMISAFRSFDRRL